NSPGTPPDDRAAERDDCESSEEDEEEDEAGPAEPLGVGQQAGVELLTDGFLLVLSRFAVEKPPQYTAECGKAGEAEGGLQAKEFQGVQAHPVGPEHHYYEAGLEES